MADAHLRYCMECYSDSRRESEEPHEDRCCAYDSGISRFLMTNAIFLSLQRKYENGFCLTYAAARTIMTYLKVMHYDNADVYQLDWKARHGKTEAELLEMDMATVPDHFLKLAAYLVHVSDVYIPVTPACIVCERASYIGTFGIQCNKLGCEEFMHVECAGMHGLDPAKLWDMNQFWAQPFCPKHSPPPPADMMDPIDTDPVCYVCKEQVPEDYQLVCTLCSAVSHEHCAGFIFITPDDSDNRTPAKDDFQFRCAKCRRERFPLLQGPQGLQGPAPPGIHPLQGLQGPAPPGLHHGLLPQGLQGPAPQGLQGPAPPGIHPGLLHPGQEPASSGLRERQAGAKRRLRDVAALTLEGTFDASRVIQAFCVRAVDGEYYDDETRTTVTRAQVRKCTDEAKADMARCLVRIARGSSENLLVDQVKREIADRFIAQAMESSSVDALASAALARCTPQAAASVILTMPFETLSVLAD